MTMSEFFPEIEVREVQAEAIARGLYAIARADGNVHEREAAMIGEFFNSTTEHHADLGALARAPNIEPANLAALLPTAELRQLFIKTALLLAYVDGDYAPGEQTAIADYAKAMNITDVAAIEVQVKDYLLGHLTHLHNVQGVVDVAKTLKR
jgi:tellurite resistance protein